ncbi:helicase associated domain-containing protein [Streptomyces coeruleorubidus]|uniref:helicase associated domain-containing protein n=1 Tax=Streptomyces coeruleorubidus TaxID=116188 RepID=UPI0037F3C62E
MRAGTAWDEVEPGTGLHRVDVGRWLAQQREHAVWQGLMDAQRERLQALGVTALPPEQEVPAKAPRAASGAFERGVAALTQYKARTGTVGPVSRSHIEVLPDGSEVRLGVCLTNAKIRLGKLSAERLQALADLGVEWAVVDIEVRG